MPQGSSRILSFVLSLLSGEYVYVQMRFDSKESGEREGERERSGR